MNYKPFLYSSLICFMYALFLRNEKKDWIYTNSLVKNVKLNDTVITEINGLEISEVRSNADVVYKIDDTIYSNNVDVIHNQPLQFGNIVPIKYDKTVLDRNMKNIPGSKYWITLGLVLLTLSIYYYKNQGD